jgi:hypothetical protein
MSKRNQSADLSSSPTGLLLYSQEVFLTFNSPKWRILSRSSNGISAKEKNSWRTWTTWRWWVQIDITVTALTDEETPSRIDLVGYMWGFGPIVQRRLKTQMDKFLDALSQKVDTGNRSADEIDPTMWVTDQQ